MKKKAKHSPFHIHGFLKDIKVEHFKLKRKTSFKSFQSKAEFKKISSAISRNLVEFMTSMMARGGYETHTSSDVICVYSDFPTAELNYVFNLSVEEELENMKKAISFGEAKGVPFSLLCDKSHLSIKYYQLFRDRKVVFEEQMALMAFDLLHELHVIEDTPFDLSRVTTKYELQEWSSISDEAFGLDFGTNYLFFSKINRLLSPDSTIELYLHHEGDKPVGATLLYFPKHSKIAGTYWWGVRKDYTHQGIGSHMVENMISISQEKGYKYLVAQCLDTSAGLANSIGFDKYSSIDAFLRQLPESKKIIAREEVPQEEITQ